MPPPPMRIRSSSETVDQLEEPAGCGLSVVGFAVVDRIAQSAPRAIRDEHMSREPARQQRPFAGLRQTAMHQHGRAGTFASADHVRAFSCAVGDHRLSPSKPLRANSDRRRRSKVAGSMNTDRRVMFGLRDRLQLEAGGARRRDVAHREHDLDVGGQQPRAVQRVRGRTHDAPDRSGRGAVRCCASRSSARPGCGSKLH